MEARGSFFLGNRQFETKNFDLPNPGAHEVILENQCCGICGTDVHIYFGQPGASDVNPPVVLGHEYSGRIVAVGDDVTALQVGDHVTVDPHLYCGTCHYCRNGAKQLCSAMEAIGVNRNGGFAQYSLVPAGQCLPVLPTLDFEAAAMSEPLACCLHGIDRAEIRPGMNVCIIGGGPIGLLMVQLARLSGAANIVLSEPVEMRRKIGLSLGADYAIDPTTAPMEQLMLRTLGRPGADVVIECVGIPKAAAQAFEAADKGATIVLFSVQAPGAAYAMDLFQAFRKELTVKTSFVNPDTHQRAVALLNSGRIQTAPLITHRFPLDQVEQAIEKQMQPDSIKVVVLPWA